MYWYITIPDPRRTLRRYLTDDHDHLLRVANQSIVVFNSRITDNANQAFYALSPFRYAEGHCDIQG